MANKISNVSYDQIPHIVKNHPDTNPEHWAIMIVLFKILKDKHQCIYSTEKLAIDCRMTLRTTERRLSELKKMMLISTIGTSYNRRISLGILFNTSAILADKNSTPPPKDESQPAKTDSSARHGGGYNKPYNKPSINEDLSAYATSTPKPQTPSIEEQQQGKFYFEHPEYKTPEEFKEAVEWYRISHEITP